MDLLSLSLSHTCTLPHAYIYTAQILALGSFNAHVCSIFPHLALALRSNHCFMHMYALVFSLDSSLCMNNGSVLTQIFCSQNQSIEMRREAVLRGLILYLGEKEEDLFEDCLVKQDFFMTLFKMLVLSCKVQVNPKV